ncbi:MAG: PEP-CTERM sorting domain-containing protein [Myxococcales bacterium]
MRFGIRGAVFSLALMAAVTFAATSFATTLSLSDVSSDATPAASLSGSITLDVLGGNTLSLTLSNQTSAPDAFLINGVWWNADAGVTGLSLTAATHSVSGDVLAAWTPVESGTNANGFGAFDFALTDGVGASNPNLIPSGESVVFLMTITGSCTTTACTAANFVLANGSGYQAAAKFVSGPDDPESPGNEDSAFGAVIPEPTTAMLLGTGLLLIGLRRR